MEVEIPRDLVGKVIGSRGSVINAMRDESGAEIRLDKHDDGSATLTVQGSETSLEQVAKLMKMTLEGEPPEALADLDGPKPPRRAAGRAPGSDGASSLLSPPVTTASMGRYEAEELAEQWQMARRERDYATADAIRARLRKASLEPEDIVDEISWYGRTPRGGGEPAPSSAPAPTAKKDDPLAYRPTVERNVEWGPTDAAKNHRDGGTGGLLTLNYQQIEPLPADLGFVVTSSYATATKEPLLALKRLQEEEEERTRREIRERNAMTRAR